jgi:hypothetical protein
MDSEKRDNRKENNPKRKRSGAHKVYTPWHILLDEVMAYFFDSEEIEVRAFEKLGVLPLESDFLILCRKKNEETLREHYPVFKFLLPYLGPMTVVEYKSPLDRLTHHDFDLLRVYRLLIKRKYKLRRDDQVWAATLASHFESGYAGYVEENGYEFRQIEPGVWGHERGCERFYWLDLAAIGQRDSESLINLFSSNYQKYRHSLHIRKTEAGILTYVWQNIFKEELTKMRHEKLRHLPQFTTSMEEITKSILDSFTIEERLAGLSLAEILAKLSPEERLAGLGPEERLAGLGPEERLAGLSKSQREKLKKLLESQS